MARIFASGSSDGLGLMAAQLLADDGHRVGGQDLAVPGKVLEARPLLFGQCFGKRDHEVVRAFQLCRSRGRFGAGPENLRHRPRAHLGKLERARSARRKHAFHAPELLRGRRCGHATPRDRPRNRQGRRSRRYRRRDRIPREL